MYAVKKLKRAMVLEPTFWVMHGVGLFILRIDSLRSLNFFNEQDISLGVAASRRRFFTSRRWLFVDLPEQMREF
jgi:hypothetical protein